MRYRVMYVIPGVSNDTAATLDINAVNLEVKESAVVFTNANNVVVAVVSIRRLLCVTVTS